MATLLGLLARWLEKHDVPCFFKVNVRDPQSLLTFFRDDDLDMSEVIGTVFVGRGQKDFGITLSLKGPDTPEETRDIPIPPEIRKRIGIWGHCIHIVDPEKIAIVHGGPFVSSKYFGDFA